jgi:cell division inhibitor SepF
VALSWHKTLVYFGLAEERDPELDSNLESAPRSGRGRGSENVRRMSRGGGTRTRGEEDFDDIFGEDEHPTRAVLRPVGGGSDSRRGSARNGGSVRMHLVIPKSFNDAQQIADRFKDDIPVVLNLQNTDTELSKRLIDFASGLTYALDGGMQRVADRVFMLTPRNVEVSAEERAQLIEKGFFNQS